MLLYTEDLQQMNETQISDFKLELLDSMNTIDVPTVEELEGDLNEYYIQTEQIDKAQYRLEAMASYAVDAGGSIFEKIRKFICGFLAADSTVSDIIDKILDAISSIIPGGIIIKWIVKKLVKYILNMGYQALCPA